MQPRGDDAEPDLSSHKPFYRARRRASDEKGKAGCNHLDANKRDAPMTVQDLQEGIIHAAFEGGQHFETVPPRPPAPVERWVLDSKRHPRTAASPSRHAANTDAHAGPSMSGHDDAKTPNE
ncbi:hypothetical protein ACCO45_001501 [Purpureocillium lilacinum]|uniref:Uncharacterized protein n=1 Tax=Purpureocillium lilacinum TaxID=33203 RepID=A0ACC4E8C9_PURLI